MLIIKTITHETIWGGQKLKPYSDIKTDKIGHLYSLVSNSAFESEILNGKYKGCLFKKYFDENKDKFHLSKYKQFPFVIALVDASDDLSLQVHPNDKIANKLENMPFGKNESWYFLDSPKSGKIYNGCKVNTHEKLTEKILQNKYDEIIDYLEVKQDDYVYVEAGTMHAMSKGSFVYEIEENCNITYRVWDFERRDKNGNLRPLHTKNAIESIDVNLKSKALPSMIEHKERLYTTKMYKNKNEYTNTSNTLECLTVINGGFEVEGFKIQKGTTVVLEPSETLKTNNSDFITAKANIEEIK